MFFLLVYTLSGLAILIFAIGKLHKPFWERLDRSSGSNVRLAAILLGTGLTLLGLYNGYNYLIVAPELKRMEDERRRQYLEQDELRFQNEDGTTLDANRPAQ